MTSSSSHHDSRVLSASSSMLSLSSTEWDGDETGLNTGFFETSDSDSDAFRTPDSGMSADTDASEERRVSKKKVLKKTSPKEEDSSSSESDPCSAEDTKKKTSTPMKKYKKVYSLSQEKVKEDLQNFLKDFSMPDVKTERPTSDSTSSGDEKPAKKKMKIQGTVKTEPRSSSESSESEDEKSVKKQDTKKAELRHQKKMIKQHLKLQNEELKETKKKISSLRDENLLQAKRIRKLRKDMFQRKQKLKVLAENSDHLQDRLRRRDEKIKGLIDKNFKLTEKLKKDPDAHICIICFDSFHDKEVKPASLACGHTYCMKCVTGPNGLFAGKLFAKCPNCREVNCKKDIRQIYFS